jgi:small subunit ribosomal protein S4e
MHLKRSNIPKFWPIPRKGTKYIAVASHNQNESIPLLLVLRDNLKILKNKKELKRLLLEKKVLVNHKPVREFSFPVSLLDIITIPDMKANYQIGLSKNKKMTFEKVSDKEAQTKVYKVLNKKVLGDKKIQLNLMHGKNIISKENVKTGDSVLFDFKENKIVKVIKMEKGKNAFVIEGKHAGYHGKIEEILERGGKNIAKITSDKEKINVWLKNIIVMEN